MSARTDKVHDTCRKKWDHARRFWQPNNDLWGRMTSFALDLDHYKQGETYDKDRRRSQPKTQRQFNLIRHKKALMLREDPQFDTHAVQPGADSNSAEVSSRIIDNVFKDPLKGYHDSRDRLVTSALAGGRGVTAIDWHPKWGIVFRSPDPRRVHITPGHTFLHSPLNPCVHEEVPMKLSAVQAMKGWTVPKNLKPDNWKPDHDSGSAADSKRMDLHGGDGQRPGAEDDEDGDGIVTVLKCWYREDPYQSTVKVARDADLPEDEWFFIDDQTQLRLPFDPTNPVPPMSPETGAPMRLVTSRSEMNEFAEYPEGYLVILAPFSGPEKAILFEGSWTAGALNQQATLSAFPYMELIAYRHPLRRVGISDTELTHSLTIVDNSTFRSTYQQVSTAGGILTALKGGLEDSEGKPFRITSDPINIAWAKDAMSMNSLNFFQAMGMNPAMPAFRQMIEAQWQHIGTGDMSSSLGPERSKDIAVGTVNLLQQSGDLPAQLHGKDLALQEAIGGRVVLDLCRAYMGDQVVSWVEDNGSLAYATVRGSDLVPMNVTVRADKEWRQQDVDKMNATAQFFGNVSKMGLPPQVVIAMLQEMGASPRFIGALTDAVQASPPPPGAGTGQPGQGGPQPPPQAGGPPPLSVVEGMGTQ